MEPTLTIQLRSKRDLNAHKAPFVSSNRIWIGSYEVFPTDMSDYDSLLTAEGIAQTTETPTVMAHRWVSGLGTGSPRGAVSRQP